MSRTYNVPPDTSEKEKAIGGILTFAQFGWLIAGVILGLLVFVLTKLIIDNTIFNLICAIPFACIGLPFAFYTKYEMSLVKYLREKKKFKQKNKQLINTRKERGE